MDVEYLEWGEAWNITQKVFSYTNHTVLPEALESWSVDLLGNLLPRHLQIIYQINQHFLDQLVKKYPNDMDRLRNLSIIEEGEPKRIRMSFLAIIGSHTVNGVSALHTELLKTTIFKHFFEMFPKKFQNKTNGITPRRWLKNANPELSKLITREIGSEWTKDLSKLKKLEPFATNESFQKEWRNIKLKKKEQFAQVVYEKTGIKLNLNSIFDVQVKRIHEYKRQLLNILYVITLYNRIRNQPNQRRTPRTIIIGGKAAPGYYMAKLIIHLINDVAKCINRDPVVGDQLKLIFLENYNVSLAQKIIPATELSEQISTAGMEASGTGNMKFALNGALTIGTLDGANVEMLEEVGKDNIFIFGLTAKQVQEKKAQGYNPRIYYQDNAELRETLEMINTGYFNRENPYLYNDIYNSLVYDDYYLLFADYFEYVKMQEKVDEIYLNKNVWTKMSILNTANMGKFSSDRTITQYANDIWKIKPVSIKKRLKKDVSS